MSYLSDFLLTPKNKFEENQKEKAINLVERFSLDATVIDGIVRWNSNGSVPPVEILNLWNFVKLDFDFSKSIEAQRIDQTIFIENYKKSQANRTISNEERFEMESAFGKGVTVVDVFTGNTFEL